MKTLLLLISLVSFNAFSQVQPPPADSTFQSINLRMEKAGTTMQHSSRRAITGTLLMIGGSVIMIAGNEDPSIMLVGAGLATVGFFVHLDGYARIGLAGRQLRGKAR